MITMLYSNDNNALFYDDNMLCSMITICYVLIAALLFISKLMVMETMMEMVVIL